MSIGNLILQRPAGYLITDSGWYNRNGTVARLAPKVLEIPRHGIAVTAQGQSEPLAGLWREVEHFAAVNPEADGAALIANLADLFAAMTIAQGIKNKGVEHDCKAQALYYCPEQKRTRGYLIANGAMRDGLDPFVLTPVSVSLGCGVEPFAPFGEPCTIADPQAFDVRRDGARLATIQRQSPWSLPGWPEAHYVAGTIYLTTVDAAGAADGAVRSMA